VVLRPPRGCSRATLEATAETGSARGRLADAVVVALEPDSDEGCSQRRELAGVAVNQSRESVRVGAEPEALRRPQRPPVGERVQLFPGDLGLAEEDVDADVADALELLEQRPLAAWVA
jgi:hypothetical protein